MRVRFGCCLVLALAVCVAQASERADFTTGEGTNGWTISAAEYVSPTYAGAVDRISLSYSGTAAGSATVNAIANGGGEASVATLSAAANAATFDFPETTDFRAFRISTTGDWRLFSFAADVSATFLAAPSNVVATALTTDSLEVSWDFVADATGYRVSICTNRVVGASNGTEVWIDDFSRAPAAASASPGALNSSVFSESYADNQYWECNEFIYPSSSNGAIRIGASDKNKGGVLTSPHLPGGDWHLRMRAWRHSREDGTDMPIYRNSSGTISLVQVVSFTKGPGEPEEFLIKLPTLSEGDHLEFCSFTNSRPRVILDRVALVSGYSEGSPTPDVFREISVDTATSCTVENLPPSKPVFVRVTATGTRGLSSEVSADVAVDLAHPPPRAILNAFPLSDLEDGIYAQNFDSLAAITATSGEKEWLNGTTLPYWQAFKQDDSVSTFKYNGGAANTGGLYALATNQSSSVRALGAYSTKDNEFSFGLAFTNDTGFTMQLSSVVYSAQQWGFKNDTNQTLSVSAQVVDRLDWTSAYDEGWTELGATQTDVYGEGTTHDTPVNAQVLFNPAPDASSVAPGQVLMLRWTIHSLKSGKPGMIGIDDLTVTFSRARSLVIHLL